MASGGLWSGLTLSEGTAASTTVSTGSIGVPGADGEDGQDAGGFGGWSGPLINIPSLTLGSVLFAGPSSAIAQNNASLFWDNTNLRLGVRIALPLALLHLGGTGQAVTNNYGLLIDPKTAGTNNWNIWSGDPSTSFSVLATNPFNFTAAVVLNDLRGTPLAVNTQVGGIDGNSAGLIFTSLSAASGTGGFVSAIQSYPQYSGAGTAAFVIGFETQVTHSGTGTVTDAIGLVVDPALKTGGGIVANNWGIQILNQGVGTNNRGLWINQTTTGVNSYALYSDGTAKSYFAGNLGLGTTTPGAPLEVTGSVIFNTPLTVSSGGIGVATLALNSVLYGNTTAAVLALGVNATATKKFLTQVSSGAPAWGTVSAADLQGSLGPPGTDGEDGEMGFPGIQGLTGLTGAAGSNGAAGAIGLIGPPGQDGDDADTGWPIIPALTGPHAPTTFTLNGVLYGNATNPILTTAQGPANSVLTANAGAPSFSATPTVTSLTATGLTSGRVALVGTSGLLRDDANLTWDGSTLQALSTTDQFPVLNPRHIGNTATSKSYLLFQRARAGTTAVQNGDYIGQIRWEAFFNGAFQGTNAIETFVSAAPSGSVVPSAFIVYVTNVAAFDTLFSFYPAGLGISVTPPTARLHLPAGTATANTAPLKFNSGTLLTTPEIGTMEFTDDGTTGHLYVTVNVVGVKTRKLIV